MPSSWFYGDIPQQGNAVSHGFWDGLLTSGSPLSPEEWWATSSQRQTPWGSYSNYLSAWQQRQRRSQQLQSGTTPEHNLYQTALQGGEIAPIVRFVPTYAIRAGGGRGQQHGESGSSFRQPQMMTERGMGGEVTTRLRGGGVRMGLGGEPEPASQQPWNVSEYLKSYQARETQRKAESLEQMAKQAEAGRKIEEYKQWSGLGSVQTPEGIRIDLKMLSDPGYKMVVENALKQREKLSDFEIKRQEMKDRQVLDYKMEAYKNKLDEVGKTADWIRRVEDAAKRGLYVGTSEAREKAAFDAMIDLQKEIDKESFIIDRDQRRADRQQAVAEARAKMGDLRAIKLKMFEAATKAIGDSILNPEEKAAKIQALGQQFEQEMAKIRSENALVAEAPSESEAMAGARQRVGEMQRAFIPRTSQPEVQPQARQDQNLIFADRTPGRYTQLQKARALDAWIRDPANESHPNYEQYRDWYLENIDSIRAILENERQRWTGPAETTPLPSGASIGIARG